MLEKPGGESSRIKGEKMKLGSRPHPLLNFSKTPLSIPISLVLYEGVLLEDQYGRWSFFPGLAIQLGKTHEVFRAVQSGIIS